MNMNKIFKDAFSEITPQKSADEIARSVTERTELMNKNTSQNTKKTRRAVLIAAVAAAALGITAVSVAATNYFKPTEQAYEELFTPKSDNKEQPVIDSEGEIHSGSELDFDYDSINYVIDKTFEYDDYTLIARGMITDGEDGYVLFDLIFGENSGYEQWCDKKYGKWGADFRTNKTAGGNCANSPHIEGNVLTFYTHVIDFEKNDEPIIVDIKSMNYQNNRGKTTELDINASVEIPLSMDMTKFNRSAALDEGVVVNVPNYDDIDVKMTLESIDVSPLGIKIHFGDCMVSREFIRREYKNIPTVVNFKDGSKMEIGTWLAYEIDEEAHTFAPKLLFNFPVTVEDISSVEVLGVDIPVK